MYSFENNLDYARRLDAEDPLAPYRSDYFIPKTSSGTDSIYLCGNSLGLQHKDTKKYITEELEDWKQYGVEGHFYARHPWMPYHEFLTGSTARLVGARDHEVVVMNSLTVNLHLLFASFYRPTANRYKIVIEQDAFPSDRYVVDSQVNHYIYHGVIPKNKKDEAVILWKSKEKKATLDLEALEKILKTQGDEVALVFIGGVNYYTGQYFDIKKITTMAHNMGAVAGFDLAHAVGNIPLALHDWGADFAAWCSYKYLNSGPGGIAGVFVHERHSDFRNLPRFTGWWGHNKTTRFGMRDDFDAIPGAEGWQLSNPPIFQLASLRASMDVFDKIGMETLSKKSIRLTGYLEYLINQLKNPNIEIITPSDPVQRGCQLSIRVKNADKHLFDCITNDGVIADWRAPDVIRVAPVPLYNRFEDVWNFVNILSKNLIV